MAVSGTRLMSASPPSPSPPAISTPTNGNLKLQHQMKKNVDKQKQALSSFSVSVSRRDMIRLTAQTLTAATFWSAKPAEARLSRSEMKKKLLEKLEQLREKAGFAKPKSSEGKNPSPIPSSSSSSSSGLESSNPSPTPPENLVKTMVESVFP